MSYQFPKLTKEEENQIANDVHEYLKDETEKELKVLDQIKLSDIKKYLDKTIEEQPIIGFDESEKDYSEPRNQNKDINFYGEILEMQVTKYLKLTELLEWTGFMEYRSHVPYDDFIEKGHDITGNAVMFTDWFIPLLINDEKVIFSQISGQGEVFYSIQTVKSILEKYPKSGFNYINKYYSLNEILK